MSYTWPGTQCSTYVYLTSLDHSLPLTCDLKSQLLELMYKSIVILNDSMVHVTDTRKLVRAQAGRYSKGIMKNPNNKCTGKVLLIQ